MDEFFLNRPSRILLATNSLVLLAGAMLGPIYALFVEEIGGSLLDAGLTAGVFALAAGITTLAAGRYADKIKNREIIVVFGYVVMGIGFLSYTAVDSIWALFLVQVIIGFGEAVYAPSFDTLYSKHLSKDKPSTAWAVWESTYYFTTAAGAVIGAFIAYSFGFPVLFIIMAVMCFLSALYIYILPRGSL